MGDIIKDQYGLLYSSELLLSIIVLIFIIGIISNLSDGLNEKMLTEEELSSLPPFLKKKRETAPERASPFSRRNSLTRLT